MPDMRRCDDPATYMRRSQLCETCDAATHPLRGVARVASHMDALKAARGATDGEERRTLPSTLQSRRAAASPDPHRDHGIESSLPAAPQPLPRRALDLESLAATAALASTRKSRRGPGLTAESLAAMHRDFAKPGDRRRTDRARQRTWKRP